jgi:negative regulator of sigma E activity
MITITGYSVDPIANVVHVDYTYNVQDAVANEPIPRINDATLSQAVPPLNVPNWSDTDLCSALDAALGQPAGSCVMAQPAP